MTKRLDPDVKALRACVRAIEKSSSERMKRANVEFLYDRYVRHPKPEPCETCGGSGTVLTNAANGRPRPIACPDCDGGTGE